MKPRSGLSYDSRMKKLAILICLFALAASAQVKGRARGSFDVKRTQQPDNLGQGLGRALLDKAFHGDLEGTSKGQMLSALSEVKGSGVYVAIERVTGTLAGRSGTFDLYHTGIMKRGAQQLSINVVPDSGTGQLKGLSGSMTIQITADGKHSYQFEYSIEAVP